MKILDQEELDAHYTATAIGAAKGTATALVFCTGVFTLGVKRWPRIKKLPTSIKAAMWVMPVAASYALGGELASQAFDQKMYQSQKLHDEMVEANKKWAALSTKGKIVTTLSENRYEILGGSWLASMWGSWLLVDRDPIMSKAQKIVQARMYAQALTIVLLLGTVYLSVYEKDNGMGKVNKTRADWEKVMHDAEEKGRLKMEAEEAAKA